jgi:probable HAF family extracellular repeat protein
MKMVLSSLFLTATLALAAPALCATPRFSVVDLGVLDARSPSTFGAAINNSGVVVGQSLVADHYHAFYWNGHIHDIGTFGQSSSYATDINDVGTIIGTAGDPGASIPILFEFHNGQKLNLGSPKNTYALVANINNINTIVATPNSITTGCDSSDTPYVITLPSAARHPLGILGCNNYVTIGIDDRNEILASPYLGSNPKGFVSSRNSDFDLLGSNASSVSMTAIDKHTDHVAGTIQIGSNLYPVLYIASNDRILRLPPTSRSLPTGIARAINRHDEIVGTACATTANCDGGNHAFLYEPGVGMTDLTIAAHLPRGFSEYVGVAINDRGQIVVDASNPPLGPNRSFLLTPIP